MGINHLSSQGFLCCPPSHARITLGTFLECPPGLVSGFLSPREINLVLCERSACQWNWVLPGDFILPSPFLPADHPWSFPQMPQSRARRFFLSSFLFVRSFFSIMVLAPGEVHLDSHSWFPKCALWSLSVLHARSKWKFGIQRVFLKATPWLILCGYGFASLRVVYLLPSRMGPRDLSWGSLTHTFSNHDKEELKKH